MDIIDIIEKVFKLQVYSLSMINESFDCFVYLVNNEYIFKQSKRIAAREKLKREVEVLRYLEGRITLQIPQIEYYSEEYSVCGYREIVGSRLNRELYDRFTEKQKEKLAIDIAQFLRELHAVPLPNIEGLELEMLKDYQNDYAFLQSNIYQGLSDKVKVYIDALFDKILNDERLRSFDNVLCHNDFTCRHIITVCNEAVGIIDFGDSVISDRDKDFLYLLEESDVEIGREFGFKVIDSYGKTNKNTALFKSDLNVEYRPIEEMIIGYNRGLDRLYQGGLSKIIARCEGGLMYGKE